MSEAVTILLLRLKLALPIGACSAFFVTGGSPNWLCAARGQRLLRTARFAGLCHQCGRGSAVGEMNHVRYAND